MTATKPAKMSSPMLNGPVLPTLSRLAVPNTVSNLLFVTPSLVEAWRISALGASEIAGVALVFPLYMLLTMWSAGSVGGAVSGAIARAVGAGEIARAESVLRSGIIIGLGGGIVMMALVLGLGRWLFVWLGDSETIGDIAWSYASILFLFNAIIWLFNMLIGVMRGSGDMIRPLITVFILATVHVVLSGPVILGLGETGGWGVAGAAALMIISYGVGLFVVLIFMSRPTAQVRLRLGAIDWKLTVSILKPGLFAAIQSVTTIATSMILAGLAARFGPDVLAGYGIGARIELIMIPLIFGVGGATIAMSGAATGAGMRDRALRVAWTSAIISCLLIGLIGVLLAIFAVSWAPAFSANAAITATLMDYIVRVGPVYGFLALGMALFFASQGMQTLLYPVLGPFARLLVILVGAFVVFSAEEPDPNHLFIVIALGMATYGIFIATCLRLGPWRP